MFPCNPFRSNTYKTSRKCSFQKTYTKAKSFSSNTYKKPGVGQLAQSSRWGSKRSPASSFESPSPASSYVVYCPFSLNTKP
jgi:hypothetical protein